MEAQQWQGPERGNYDEALGRLAGMASVDVLKVTDFESMAHIIDETGADLATVALTTGELLADHQPPLFAVRFPVGDDHVRGVELAVAEDTGTIVARARPWEENPNEPFYYRATLPALRRAWVSDPSLLTARNGFFRDAQLKRPGDFLPSYAEDQSALFARRGYVRTLKTLVGLVVYGARSR